MDTALETESSEELLVLVSFGKDEEEAAKAAFYKLVIQFRELLLRVTEAKCRGGAKDVGDAKDIVENTFQRMKKYATSYDPKRGKAQDPSKRVLGWLIGIMRKEYVKYYAHSTGEVQAIDEAAYERSLEGARSFPDDFTLTGSTKHLKEWNEALYLALASLSTNERIVYLIYQEYVPEDGYIPREVKQMLARDLGLLPKSLNVYKQRAQEKLAKLLKN